MENIITQRVREFLSCNSISINSLAKQINVAQATLNPQLRGDRTLAANIVVKILEHSLTSQPNGFSVVRARCTSPTVVAYR